MENAHQRPSAAQFIITATQVYTSTIYYIHLHLYVSILGAAPALSEINLFGSAPDVASGCGRLSGVPQAQSVKRLHQMMQLVRTGFPETRGDTQGERETGSKGCKERERERESEKELRLAHTL